MALFSPHTQTHSNKYGLAQFFSQKKKRMGEPEHSDLLRLFHQDDNRLCNEAFMPVSTRESMDKMLEKWESYC